MKRYTRDNFSTAFQLIIIALLFTYAAFPGKSVINEKPAANSLLTDKTNGTHKKVKPHFINRPYISNVPQQTVSNKMLIWVIPDKKIIMNDDPEIKGVESVNMLKINSK